MLQMYCLWRCFFFWLQRGKRQAFISNPYMEIFLQNSGVNSLSLVADKLPTQIKKAPCSTGTAATLFLFPLVKCCYFIPLFCKETFRTRSTKEGILRGPLQRSYTELHFTVNKCNVQYFNGRLTTNLAGNFVRG